MNSLRVRPPLSQQRGAAFIVMLVIMIMGITIALVGTLSKVTLQTERNNQSSDLLAQAKDIIVGNIVNGTGGQMPGNTLTPDTLSSLETPQYNYDGTVNSGCLDASKTGSLPIPGLPLISSGNNMRCLGRLPWKAYGMYVSSDSQNDPTGIMPWYAVSANLADPANVTFNSELLNTAPHPWLTVRDMNGNVLSNRVAFVILIPSIPINGQLRPDYPNLGGADQYLDNITVSGTCTAPCVPGTYSNADMDDDFIMGNEHRWIDDPTNPGKQIEDPNYHFNDKLIYVTIDELMPLIEKRIGREVKSCLDDYAASSANKYPWAAPITDTGYTGTYNTLFGRIPNQPNINSSDTASATATTLTDALTAMQAAVDNYFAVGSAANQTALANAANNVIILRNTIPAISATILTAGTWGFQFAYGSHTYAGVTQKVTTAQAATANNLYPTDATMATTWPASCTTLFATAYWPNWQNLVFYQIDNKYRPSGTTAACTLDCLTISGSGNPNTGSGNYRAAVLIAGKKLGAQTRANPYANPPIDYLGSSTSELSSDPSFIDNAHDSASSTPASGFISYKASDPYYQTVNDLVLCLDGKNNCK